MTRRRWATLVVALAVVETSAALAAMWVTVAVISAALTGLVCLWAGRRWAWRDADEHYRGQLRGFGQRLAALEAFEAVRAEIEHAQIRDGGPWPDNGAGYRSPRFTPSDSPARTGAELSQGAS